MIVAAQRDPAFRAALGAAALSLCDTVGVLYAARMYGVRIPERVTGVDLIDPLCEALARAGLRSICSARKAIPRPAPRAALAARHPGCGSRALATGISGERR